MNLAKTWNSVLGSLEIQLPRVEYNTWLRRTELVHLDTQLAVVSTTTPMLREAVESRYMALIGEQLREIIGYSVTVRVIVGPYVPDPTPVSDSDIVGLTSGRQVTGMPRAAESSSLQRTSCRSSI